MEAIRFMCNGLAVIDDAYCGRRIPAVKKKSLCDEEQSASILSFLCLLIICLLIPTHNGKPRVFYQLLLDCKSNGIAFDIYILLESIF